MKGTKDSQHVGSRDVDTKINTGNGEVGCFCFPYLGKDLLDS